jgi:type IX secretion system PorP/SprF family membrane protein
MKFQKFSFVLLLLPTVALSNPDVALNQSPTSGYLLNPAYAGMQEFTYASLQVRTQWAEMPGAPQQQYLSLEHSLLPQKVGLGVTLFNEQSNVIVNTGGYFTYRYTLRLSQRQRLSPAISLGFVQNAIDFGRIAAENPFEATLTVGYERRVRFNAGFGLLYTFSDFLEVGLSAYKLINSAYEYTSYATGQRNAYTPVRDFGFNMRYIKKFAENIETSALLYLYSEQGLPVEPTLRLTFAYLPYGAYLSGGYTWKSAFAFSAGIWLYDRVHIGYTVENPQAEIRSYTGITQQASIGVRISRPSQAKSGGALAKDVEDLRRLNQENFEQVERVDQAQEVSQRSARQQQARIDSLEREVAYLKQMAAAAQDELKNLHKSLPPADTLQPDSVPTDTTCCYVVVGYYLHRGYAERYRRLLMESIQLATEILEWNNAYYVYTKVARDHAEVQQEYRRLRQYGIDKYIYGNVWALKKTKQ